MYVFATVGCFLEQNSDEMITEPESISSIRIPTEFQRDSERITKGFQKDSEGIPKGFLKDYKRITKGLQKDYIRFQHDELDLKH